MTLPAAIDGDLTPREVMRLSPSNKALRVSASLVRKVEYLEGVANDIPLARSIDVKLFSSRSALRNWNDVALGLWRWGDSNVDWWSEIENDDERQQKGVAEGRNEKLMLRWWKAYRHILRLRRGGEPLDEKDIEIEDLKSLVKQKDLEIRGLYDQVLDLMSQIDLLMRRT